MQKLAVSAVIPTYNRADLIPRAIASVLEALEPGDEVIVVDDGSTDGTVEVVESFGDRVRLIRRPHRGAGPARNAGLEAARGPLVAFLDSDDEWHPDKIVLQRALLERRPDIVYAFSDFGVRLEDGSVHHNYLPYWMFPRRPYAEAFGEGILYSAIAPLPAGREDFQVRISSMYMEEMRNNLITAFTLIVRKDTVGDSLCFAHDLPTAEEWQAFGRLARQGPGAFMETETAWQYGHRGERLSTARRSVLAEAWLKTLDRVWGQDEEFLAAHRKEYQRARSSAQLMKATSLARHGDLIEAGRAARMAGILTIAMAVSHWAGAFLSGSPPG